MEMTGLGANEPEDLVRARSELTHHVRTELGKVDLNAMTAPQIRGRIRRICTLIGDCLGHYSVTALLINRDDPRCYIHCEEMIPVYKGYVSKMLCRTHDFGTAIETLLDEHARCRAVITARKSASN